MIFTPASRPLRPVRGFTSKDGCVSSQSPEIYAERLAALRAELAAQRLVGFVVPISDEHMSEYVGEYAQRLAWLTGFAGSAGSAAILADKAAMFTDGRYTLQVRQQVDAAHYDYVDVPASSISAWLAANVSAGQRIGFDPWLHGVDWVKAAGDRLAAVGATLVAVTQNPVDVIWTDRPVPSAAPVAVHSDTLAGQSASAKRAAMADWLKAEGLDATVITALDSVAWTFNLRGSDVSRTPVGLAFALVHADATADLFIAPEKLTDAVRQHLGNSVRLHDYGALTASLSALRGKRIAADPERAVAAVFGALEAGGATVVRRRDPAVMPKACKNPVEIQGMKNAHVRDGVAVTRFLKWLEEAGPAGGLTEASVADKLRSFREEGGDLKDLSFDTISAAGANAASPHYRFDPDDSAALPTNGIYLVDSGGQYPDGTTDITRTVVIGTPTAEMRRRFTQVLKGHIALATARFPKGTRGSQLDILARQYLWADGVDYAHGTGHGVGTYLAVHEGPARIAKPSGGQAGTEEPLHAGMILSNEPGYYKAGEYGIRIENLVLVAPAALSDAEQAMLAFETITFAPIDKRLIDPTLMSPAEIAWLNAYHQDVLAKLAASLEENERDWLVQATAPLTAPIAALAA
ncbi:MAG: aminopeptidase P family protein [Sphingopyxis sp.]|nr:aminopeptidase P family protein [Sphingopyxis sp.]